MRRRLKLFGVCLLLGGLALSLDPERIVGDTKIDLVINPLGFLQRALNLWDPAYFGQLQNQAYGYLFPNGPFHALFIALDMPPWLVQRLWLAVLLCAAFLGTVRLAGALGIGTLHTRIVAGLAYALAPRVLTLLSYNSAELQPMLLLPWIMLPLVYGTRHGRSPMRMAMLSALAFLCCGGTNAASELAVLVVPLLYLLTRKNGARKWRLLVWWLVALFLVSFWWLAPLFLMGRYVFSFMPFTEDAATTLSVTSLTNALRGAANWMGYVPTQQATLPAGAELATTPWLVAATAVVAGLGLTGLVHRRMPERTFLALCVLTGTAIIVSGYTGSLSGALAPSVQPMFDGVLSPFRNIHKFDAAIRLPVALGLAQLPVAIGRDNADRRAGIMRALALPPSVARRSVAGVSAVAFTATLTPVATVGVAPNGSFGEIPEYWYEATDWIDENAHAGMTMAVPGSARGEYEWGRPMDEPMQPLMESAWTNHQIIPWGSAGVSRLNQEIDQRISSGRGSAGLTAALARMGVTHLLVRNDLQRSGNNGGWPARVHQALAESPGISHEKSFGPEIGSLEVHRAAEYTDQPYRAVQVYTVAGAAPTVGTVPADEALRVTGGPESLLAMAERGMLRDDRPVIVGDDPGAEDIAAEDTVVTDTSRRREIVYSDVRHNTSNTLAADEELQRDAPAPDIMDPAWEDFTSVAEYSGIESVSASSSESGANASPEVRDPGRAPFAAFDGFEGTSWRSSAYGGALGEWLEVEFSEPREVGELSVSFEQIPGEPPPSRVSLITDDDRTTAAVAATDEPQDLVAPPGETGTLRIRIDELAWEPEYRFGTRAGISDISVSGLDPERTLRVPGVADAENILFTGSTGTVPGCMRGSIMWVCNPEIAVQGEDAYSLDRTFELSADAASGRHSVSGEVVITDPVDVQNAANREGGYPEVDSTSTAVQHPAAMGRNAFDGDDGTIWYPDPGDEAPSLDVDLGEKTKVDAIQVNFPRPDSVLRPVRATVETGSTVREGWLDGDGQLSFAPVSTDELILTFDPPEGQPLEVSGISLPGVDPLEEIEGGDVRTVCGLGPTLRVNGERVDTRITGGSVEGQLNGSAVRYESCDDVGLQEGGNRVRVEPGNRYRIESAQIEPSGAEERDEVRTADVSEVAGWGDSERRLDVDVAEDSYLVVNENFNDGWVATVNGSDTTLEPVRLDGWKQAWLLPAGTSGTVTLSYAPDDAYHAALGIGAVLALVAGLLALRRPRGRWATRAAASPAARPGGVPRGVLIALGVGYGVWVAGAAGAGLTGAALLLVWWLSRAPSERIRYAKPGRPLLGGRVIRSLGSPWTVLVSLGCAGLALGAGNYLVLTMPFHEVSEWLGEALRGWVAQLCCLPALARLVLSLGNVSGPDRAPAADPAASAAAQEGRPGPEDSRDTRGREERDSEEVTA
nr:alpha-(1->3)-arabinofuranosyltransferase [Lipingzhangella halophila]